jgi:hypothetical protein
MMFSVMTLGKFASILASLSGIMVGINIVMHGGSTEIPLAISVTCGSLGALLTGHGEHDPKHVVVHRYTDRH